MLHRQILKLRHKTLEMKNHLYPIMLKVTNYNLWVRKQFYKDVAVRPVWDHLLELIKKLKKVQVIALLSQA